MLHVIKRLEKLTNIQLTGIMLGFSLLLVFIGALIWRANNSMDSVDENKIHVSATIAPLADIVKQVGGDRVEVVQLLPAGATPHSYDMSPGQVAKVSQSKILFVIGHGLDNWANEFATANNIPVVTADKDINLITSSESLGQYDPHYWLSIPNAMLMSKTVQETLSATFPEYADEFLQNQNEYATELAKADVELRQRLGNQPRQIAVFHGAWDYMARDYGIEIVSEFEEFPGTDPTPQYLADFRNKILSSNVKTIFVEPQLSTDTIRPFAADLGVDLVLLDPLGGIDERPTYIDMMRFNISQIVDAN